MTQRLIIIRIRGIIGVKKTIEDTMRMLRLYKKNSCVVVNNGHSTVGMIKKIKDFVTWGELDKETFKLLISKRGKLPGNKPLTENYLKEKTKLDFEQFSNEFMESKKELRDVPGLKQFFRLKPPEK